MFILVFLLSIKISFQLEIKLNLSNTIPNITTTIKQSSLFQKLNISLPLLYSCFGTPSQCFNMTFETTYYNTFLDGTGDYFRNSFNKTHSQTFNTTNQSLRVRVKTLILNCPMNHLIMILTLLLIVDSILLVIS